MLNEFLEENRVLLLSTQFKILISAGVLLCTYLRAYIRTEENEVDTQYWSDRPYSWVIKLKFQLTRAHSSSRRSPVIVALFPECCFMPVVGALPCKKQTFPFDL